jgi:hypothetical protein
MFLLEILIIVQNYSLSTDIFPAMTAFQLVTNVHRLFPAFMNACRCLTSAYYDDPKVVREKYLEEISLATRDLSLKSSNLIQSMEDVSLAVKQLDPNFAEELQENEAGDEEDENSPEENGGPVGFIEKILTQRRKYYQSIAKNKNEVATLKKLEHSLHVIENPQRLIKQMTNPQGRPNTTWILFRNLMIYLVIHYCYRRVMSGSGTTTNTK